MLGSSAAWVALARLLSTAWLTVTSGRKGSQLPCRGALGWLGAPASLLKLKGPAPRAESPVARALIVLLELQPQTPKADILAFQRSPSVTCLSWDFELGRAEAPPSL